jgi:hypothetical protein
MQEVSLSIADTVLRVNRFDRRCRVSQKLVKQKEPGLLDPGLSPSYALLAK